MGEYLDSLNEDDLEYDDGEEAAWCRVNGILWKILSAKSVTTVVVKIT